MSFFGVTKEEIEEMEEHPNADRLEICRLKNLSFSFVVEKGLHFVGEKVLYFPIDSLLPFELMDKMGFVRDKIVNKEVVKDKNGNPIREGILSGPNHNRVKTIKLRGIISQGIIGPLSLIDKLDEGSNFTEFLGVEKYEPEPIVEENCELRRLPEEISVLYGISGYDIEGADYHPEIIDILMDEKVYVTEKVEGKQISITYRKDTDEFFVNQRNYTIIPTNGKENNTFWKTALSLDLFDKMKRLLNFNSITFFGELLGPGIQKNIYKFKNHNIAFYDIFADGKFIDANKKIFYF